MHKNKPWLRFLEGAEGASGAAGTDNTGGAEGASGADGTDNTGEGTKAEDAAGGTDGDGEPMSVEDYQRELARVRREAAKYRTERNDLRPLADKAREAEEANKTELEKAQERITALEAEKAQVEQNSLRAAVSAATGVPPEFIHGDTEEQMTDYATRLAESLAPEQGQSRRLVVDAVGRQSDPPADRETFAKTFFGLT